MSNQSEQKMFEYMRFCNGEIRVMAGRYGDGWLAAGCATVEWDFDERWGDLVGGDNEYFDARDFFEQENEVVLIEGAATAREAFESCVLGLSRITDQLER